MIDQKLVAIHFEYVLACSIFSWTIILLDLRNLQFLEKVISLVHFDRFFSKAWYFGIIYLNFPKDLSKNEDF